VTFAILAGLLGPLPAAPPAPDGRPSRIIANAPSNAEIVCALGAEDLLVGVSDYAKFPESIRKLPRVGGLDDPDLETIVALRPDLVIQRGHNEHVASLCARLGIRMYADRTDSLPSLYTTITELGDLLDRRQQATELCHSIRSRLEAIAGQAPSSRPRVLLALRSPDRLTPMTTVGKSSYLHAVIELAGGLNIYADAGIAYPTIGLEEIVARSPDVILDALPGETIDEARRRELLAQWAKLATVPAVQRGDIHFLTEDYALTPSPRVTLLAARLNEIFAADRPIRDH